MWLHANRLVATLIHRDILEECSRETGMANLLHLYAAIIRLIHGPIDSLLCIGACMHVYSSY